jgi:hypothetical protein
MDLNATNIGTLREQRDELYRAAREHPGSEEDEMVEILLLGAMSKLEPAAYDATPGLAIGDERQRFQAAHAQSVQEGRTRRKAPGKGNEHTRAAEPGAAEGGVSSVAELRQEIAKRQQRLDKIEEAMKSAQAAMASGKQMTDLEIYNRIAAVVGLIPPSGPAGTNDFGS